MPGMTTIDPTGQILGATVQGIDLSPCRSALAPALAF
jgi:hypothetical protein